MEEVPKQVGISASVSMLFKRYILSQLNNFKWIPE